MSRSTVNSSSSASTYFWSDCDSYDDGAEKLGGPSAGFLILMITHCFEFLVGTPSNLWLIRHIFKKRSKVAGILPADFFPLHLALTQLLFFLSLPTFVANHYLWKNADVTVLIIFLTSTVVVLKPLLLCLVCVERYMAVVRPHDYLRFKARRYRWGCLGVAWCIYFTMSVAAVVRRSAVTVCLVFLPVLAIDTFCSLSVLKTLTKPPPGDRTVMEKKSEERRKGGRREDRVKEADGKGEMNTMKKKAFITIVVIQIVLLLNYLPFIITLPMDGRVPGRTLKCQYWAMSLAASISCSYLQPLLYLHRLGRLPCTTSQNA